MKKLLITLGLVAMLAVPASAFARTDLSVGIGLGSYYGPPPVYYAPPPRAVYYEPYPYYYGPTIEYRSYYGPRYYHHRHWRHDNGYHRGHRDWDD